MRVTSRDSLPDYLNSFNAKVAPFGCWQRTILDIVVSALIEVHAWEQRKLGDEAEILAGGDIDRTKLDVNGKYPVITNALTGDGIVGYYDDEYRIKAPAVTVTGRGDVGRAQVRTVDFTPVVRLLSVKSIHDVYFLENAINNHKVLVESTGVPQLTAPQLANYTIWSASLEEEAKSGAFFKNMNDLIALHQRKPLLALERR
jgi:type I restriction enzyme S subunit